MSDRLTTRVGGSMLKNPLIVEAAKHVIDAERVRRALAAGVVVKSANESQAPNYRS